MIRTILAVVVSSVVLFIWGMLSWGIIGWHTPKDFKDGDAVAAFLKQQVDGHGNFAYPSWNIDKTASKEEQEAQGEAMMQGIKDGPYIYATVRPGPDPDHSFGATMLRQVVIVLLASLTLLFLIQKSKYDAFPDRLSIAVLVGLFLGIMSALQQWNWMELPGRETLATFLDGIISCTLAGAAIALLLPKRAAE